MYTSSEIHLSYVYLSFLLFAYSNCCYYSVVSQSNQLTRILMSKPLQSGNVVVGECSCKCFLETNFLILVGVLKKPNFLQV